MAKYLEMSAEVLVDLSSLFGKNPQVKTEDNKSYPDDKEEKKEEKEDKV
jgi:hypothetical protein